MTLCLALPGHWFCCARNSRDPKLKKASRHGSNSGRQFDCRLEASLLAASHFSGKLTVYNRPVSDARLQPQREWENPAQQ